MLVKAIIRDVCAQLVFAVRTQTKSLGGLSYKASSLPVEYDRGHSDVGNSWVCISIHVCAWMYTVPTVPSYPIDPRGPHFHGRVPILPGKWGSGVPIFMGSPKFYDTGSRMPVSGWPDFGGRPSAMLGCLSTVVPLTLVLRRNSC